MKDSPRESWGLAERESTESEFEYSVATCAADTRGNASWHSLSSSSTFAAYWSVAPFAAYPLQRYRQLRSHHVRPHLRNRPRHRGFVIRSVLCNRLTSSPGARKRLSLFQPDCRWICTDLSRRFCTDGSSWSRAPERRLAQCFHGDLGLPYRSLAMLVLRSGTHDEKCGRAAPRSAISWSVAIVIVVVCTLTYAVTAGHEFYRPAFGWQSFCHLDVTPTGVLATDESARAVAPAGVDTRKVNTRSVAHRCGHCAAGRKPGEHTFFVPTRVSPLLLRVSV